MPIRENREKAIRHLIKFTHSAHILTHRSERQVKERAILLSIYLSDYFEVRLAASTIGGYLLADAIDHVIANQAGAWNEMMEALAIGFLGSELFKHIREIEPVRYCGRSLDDLYYIAFHSTFSSLGLWKESDCLCNHLMNLWLGQGIDQGLDNQNDFLGFYWYLMRAQHKKSWPDLSEMNAKELGEFYPLYRTVGNPDAFASALDEYCDFRLARMHEYPSQHAKKHYPEIHTDALIYGPLLLFPAELLAFKAIYEKTTGKPCTLSGNHPLLNLPCMRLPQNLTLPENQYTQRINEVGKASFGKQWNPGGLVEVLFDNPPTLATPNQGPLPPYHLP